MKLYEKKEWLAEVQESLAQLKDGTLLYPYAIHMWLADNVNTICHAKSKKQYRCVFSHFSDFSYAIKKRYGLFIIEIHAAWPYYTDDGKSPNLQIVNKFLTDIDVREVFSRTNKERIHAVITMDLTKWTNLVYGALHENLKIYCNSVPDETKSVSQLLAEVDLLLQHFFPHIKINYLKTAVEIYKVNDDADEFVAWFNNLDSRIQPQDIELATDLI